MVLNVMQKHPAKGLLARQVQTSRMG
jgi:hypothetical protein